MTLPTAYLTSTKKLEGMLNAIQTAQAPEKFTHSFLQNLEFKSNSDRLLIGVLKSLNFIDETGKPTQRYYEYLDQTQSKRILAEAIKEAYTDLFKVNKDANKLGRTEVINKLKTLTQGQYSDGVLGHMASTFTNLVKFADFGAVKPVEKPKDDKNQDDDSEGIDPPPNDGGEIPIKGLVYNINIVLPDTRDTSTYDAIFQSMRKHLK